MVDEQTKQNITNAINLLKDSEPTKRIEGINQLVRLRFNHPQIIDNFRIIEKNDTFPEVRLAAKNAIEALGGYPTNGIQQENIIVKTTEISPDRTAEILTLLENQNKKLADILDLFNNVLEDEGGKRYQARVGVSDFDMSIGSMVSLSFKWLLASIPIGIVLGIIFLFFSACTGSMF